MNLREQQNVPRGPSVSTIVWGVVVVAIAGLLVSSRLGWFTVNPGLAAVALLVIAGVGLVIGGSLAAARNRRTLDGATQPGEYAAPGDHAPSSAEPGLGPTAGEGPRRSPYETPGSSGER